MKSAYSVELNGTTYRIGPGAPTLLTLPEGEFVLKGAPGTDARTPLKFDFSVPFFSHLTEPRVLVVNPDRAAVIYNETTYYYPADRNPGPPDKPEFTLRANEFAYFLSAPDFFFAPFPRQASMPQGTTRMRKNRIERLEPITLDRRSALLLEHSGYETMRTHLQRVALVNPDDEFLLDTILTLLNPEDARALLETRLGDRPLRIDWHRYYQNVVERLSSEFDLDGMYGRLAREDPSDGVRIYLLGRLNPDAKEARQYYEQALAARRPCPYAQMALGYLALQRGEYADAVRLLRLSETSGVKTTGLSHYLRLARLGAGEGPALFQEASARLKSAPADLEIAQEAIVCALLARDGTARAEQIRTAFLATLARNPEMTPAIRANIEAYTASILAYARGDLGAFADACGKLENPFLRFQAASSRQDYAVAAKMLEQDKALQSGRNFLICYIAAKARGDEATAGGYFTEATSRMGRESRAGHVLVRLMGATVPPSVQAVADLDFPFEEMRVILVAMGLRFPAQCDGFFALARKLNVDPAFPRLLIDEVTGSNVGPAR